jgi:hypothetical protein
VPKTERVVHVAGEDRIMYNIKDVMFSDATAIIAAGLAFRRPRKSDGQDAA